MKVENNKTDGLGELLVNCPLTGRSIAQANVVKRFFDSGFEPAVIERLHEVERVCSSPFKDDGESEE